MENINIGFLSGKKREEEERKAREEEEGRVRRAEEMKRSLGTSDLSTTVCFRSFEIAFHNSKSANDLAEEARRAAIELARRRAEHEARMKYLRTMHTEREGLRRHAHRLHRPFYFSYFDLFSFFDITANA